MRSIDSAAISKSFLNTIELYNKVAVAPNSFTGCKMRRQESDFSNLFFQARRIFLLFLTVLLSRYIR